MRLRFVQVVLVATAAVIGRPLRADLITDFNPVRSWALHDCYTFGFVIPSDPVDPLYHPTACVDGLVTYGLRPSTTLYGVVYGFTTTVTGRIPPGGSATGFACGLGFTGTAASPDLVTFGDLFGSPCSPVLGNVGEFFSPLLLETSRLSFAAAGYMGLPGGGNCCGDFGARPLTITATPEPTTLALLGTGLITVVGFGRVRRHRRRGGELPDPNAG